MLRASTLVLRIGGLVGLIACGGGADTPPSALPATPPQSSEATTPEANPSRGPRVVILGTSLTAGLGVAPDEAYPAVLQRLADSAGFGVEIVNAGLSGETSAGALRRIEWLLQTPPALVVIETGANDGLRGVDPDSTAANLRGIVARIRSAYPTVPIALVQMEAPPNLGPQYTARFRAVFREVAAQDGLTLLPFLLERVAGVPALNQADGIHPTPEGAEIAARTLWPSLVPLLRPLSSSR